jgi:hypothetical protein
VVDLSDAISMAGMFDTTGNNEPDAMISDIRYKLDSIQLEEKYNSLDGIENADVNVTDEGVISIGFSFDNVEALNKSFTSMEELAGEGGGEMPMDLFGGGGSLFQLSGKTLTHSLDTDPGATEGLLGSGEDLDMISSMIDYTVDLSFDKKIKSVSVEGLKIIEQNDNMVKTRVDFGTVMKSGKYSIKVKTK